MKLHCFVHAPLLIGCLFVLGFTGPWPHRICSPDIARFELDHYDLLSSQMTKMLHTLMVLALLGLGSGEEGARLLASKSLLNRYAVEGRDLTLQYNIYNVGTRSELLSAINLICRTGELLNMYRFILTVIIKIHVVHHFSINLSLIKK